MLASCGFSVALERHTLVDDALESNDRKKTTRDGGRGDEAKGDEPEETSGVPSGLSLEELASNAGRHCVEEENSCSTGSNLCLPLCFGREGCTRTLGCSRSLGALPRCFLTSISTKRNET